MHQPPSETPTPKIPFRERFKKLNINAFLGDKKGVKYFWIAIAFVITVGVGLLLWIKLNPIPDVPDIAPVIQKKPAVKYYSPLSGILVGDEAATKRQVTAVMIENSPDARPQSGLKDAGVVFEAIAEGGITRFIALYQESRPSLIGPVRSLRPYYLEWASAFDSGIVHVGGSARALTMARSGSYGPDMDQYFNGGSFWRATDRAAPHNVYTNFDKLDALSTAKGKVSSTFVFSSRIDEKKAASPSASHINIPVSTGSFAVTYDYDTASNNYIRKQGGEAHIDREGGQIQPKVVIAIKVAMTYAMEDGYREQITTTGTGSAYVFQNGTVTEGTWSRDTDKAQLKLLDASGKEIPLVRGQTWVTALASEKVVSWQ